MGEKTTYVFKLECDRCGAEAEWGLADENSGPGRAVRDEWDKVTINNHHSKWLCPTCATKLRRFLDGSKTGQGVRFNASEDQRWESSCA